MDQDENSLSDGFPDNISEMKVSFWQSKGWCFLKLTLYLFIAGVVLFAVGAWFENELPYISFVLRLIGFFLVLFSFAGLKDDLLGKDVKMVGRWTGVKKTIFCPECGKKLSSFKIPLRSDVPFRCSSCGQIITLENNIDNST